MLLRPRSDALTLVAGAVAQELQSRVLLAQARADARWFHQAVHDRADVDEAVGVLMDRYRRSRTEAQVLIQQLAHEDEVSEMVAAGAVIAQDSA